MSGGWRAGLDGSLNDLQKVMRQWKELAAYNAGALMQVSGPADLSRWSAAFAHGVRPLGLTTSETLPVEHSSLTPDRKAAEELNRAFSEGEIPLRAYVLPGESDSHWFGITYDHWVADARSLRALMHRVFAHYAGSEADLPPLRLGAGRPSAATLLAQSSALSACIGSYFRHKRAHRVSLRDPADLVSDFLLARFPDGAIPSLRAVAKKHGVKVNDMFVAAAAQVLGELTAPERRLSRGRFLRPRRNRIAIANAVDLRGPQDKGRDDVFGLSLGYFSIIVERPEERSLTELAAGVARETETSKTQTRARRLDWNLRLARWMWDRLSHPRAKAQFFQKGMPFAAGISNFNFTGSWVDQSDDTPGTARVLDYLRISPPGPLVPIVFSLNTIGDRLSLCVTFRTTAFNRADCDRLASGFIERLCEAA